MNTEPPFIHRSVCLPLADHRGEVPKASGLNWGQREKRDPDEAYISIPREIHRSRPGFFPKHGVRFTLHTDDGEELVCVVAQDEDKAIETADGNSILGRYFRRRLGLQTGERVEGAHLHRYGRFDVSITRVGESDYWLEFAPPTLPRHPTQPMLWGPRDVEG